MPSAVAELNGRGNRGGGELEEVERERERERRGFIVKFTMSWILRERERL